MIDLLAFIVLLTLWLFGPWAWSKYLLAGALVFAYLKASALTNLVHDSVDSLSQRVGVVEDKIEGLEDGLDDHDQLPSAHDE